MATYDFTGADGDPLPSGLTARSGTFEIQNNKAVPTGSTPSLPTWVFTGEGGEDGSIEVDIDIASTSGVCGAAIRLNPSDNSHVFVRARLDITGNEGIYVYAFDGGYSQISFQSCPIPQNTTLKVEFSGDSYAVYVDGVQRHTFNTSYNQSQINHGVRLNSLSQSADNMEIVNANAGTISVSEPPKNNHVYQRSASNNKSVSFAVSYTGSPTALQYRLLDASDDTTEITTWTTFDASPSDGASTLTFTAPASATGYHVEVRFSDAAGVTDIQSLDWYVGANILIFGQSLAERLNSEYAVTPPSAYFVYDGSTSSAPTTGAGANEIASIIQGAEDIAACITNAGDGGTALTVESGDTDYWNDAEGTLWANAVNLVDGMTNGENALEFAWWHQGTRDSLAGVTEAQYLSALQSFMPRVRAAFAGKRGTLEVLTAIIARDTRGTATDASHQAIRDAQLAYVESDPDTYPVSVYPVELADGVHATEAGNEYIAQQVITTYYGVDGLVAANAPKVIDITQGDSSTELDVTFDANLLLSDTTYSTEGVRVTDNGVDATVIGFTRKNATTATIELSSAFAGPVLVWLGYGKGLTSSQLTYPRSDAIALPNTGGSYSIQAESFSEQAAGFYSDFTTENIGAPDGTYKTYLRDESGTVIYDGNATFSGGEVSITGLAVAAGTSLEGFVIDNENPHVNGAVITGVTV